MSSSGARELWKWLQGFVPWEPGEFMVQVSSSCVLWWRFELSCFFNLYQNNCWARGTESPWPGGSVSKQLIEMDGLVRGKPAVWGSPSGRRSWYFVKQMGFHRNSGNGSCSHMGKGGFYSMQTAAKKLNAESDAKTPDPTAGRRSCFSLIKASTAAFEELHFHFDSLRCFLLPRSLPKSK